MELSCLRLCFLAKIPGKGQTEVDINIGSIDYSTVMLEYVRFWSYFFMVIFIFHVKTT